MAVLLTSLLLGLAAAGKGVFEGTDKNFNSDVLGSGKNVFVKFLAPCSQGVKGYPTIKYYMADSPKKGKDYQGGRDLASLTQFMEKTLNKASCDPVTGKGCKPIEQKFIDENKDKSKAELQKIIKERAETFKVAKAEHTTAAKEWKTKEAEFKKTEKKHQMAEKILKALAKSKKDEL